ncbi:unnamed protein product, partial [marine sediment metagenome]
NGLFAKDVQGVSEAAMGELCEYQWPGNVRELENVIERAVILEEGTSISSENFPFKKGVGALSVSDLGGGSDSLSIKKRSVELERDLIKRALEETGGNKTKASKILEISHRALIYKIKNYKL